jgi:hypothetical protein
LTIGLALLASAPAGAASTFGSDFTRSYQGGNLVAGLNGVATHHVARSGASLPITSPITGTLVKVELRYVTGAYYYSGTTYAFRILTGSNPFVARSISGPIKPTETPSGFEPRIDTFVPTDAAERPRGVPIAAGEHLAVAASTGIYMIVGAPGATTFAKTGVDHDSGELTYDDYPADNDELQLRGTVEPDVDGDGYGDETQDNCPDRPNDPCAPGEKPAAAPPGTLPGPAPPDASTWPWPILTTDAGGPASTPAVVKRKAVRCTHRWRAKHSRRAAKKRHCASITKSKRRRK